MVFENPLKRRLQEGARTAGAWVQIASPITAEILSQAGFDWLLIDMEHGPGDFLTLISQLQAMKGSDAAALVRAPWNDFVIIKRILDTGVHGVLVPYVNTREEVEAAVRACRYPPEGIRGVAGSPRAQGYGQNALDYVRHANDQILLIVAVETPKAVNNIDDIVDVEELDGIFIGPMDLSTSMGHVGDAGHPEVREAIAVVERKVLNAGKILSTISGNWSQAEQLYERGYQMVTLMADGVSLARLAAAKMAEFAAAYR